MSYDFALGYPDTIKIYDRGDGGDNMDMFWNGLKSGGSPRSWEVNSQKLTMSFHGEWHVWTEYTPGGGSKHWWVGPSVYAKRASDGQGVFSFGLWGRQFSWDEGKKLEEHQQPSLNQDIVKHFDEIKSGAIKIWVAFELDAKH